MTITFTDEVEIIWKSFEYSSWELKDNFLFVRKGSKILAIYNMESIRSILFI